MEFYRFLDPCQRHEDCSVIGAFMRLWLWICLMGLSCQTLGQVSSFTLNNGLKILVKEDHRAPVVVSMVWYNVGSADEHGGKTGLSHALEHLMFKGTTKYPVGAFSKTIAALGGEYNAFTSYDYTAYFEKTAASHLKVNFELEADRMQHLLLDDVEFGKEIKVIQEERRLRTDDNPGALTVERFLATAHVRAPYHQPVIGWMSDLEHMQAADAKAWYRRFYAPNNATLVVVGDVNAKDVYSLAKTYFGALGRRPSVARQLQKEPPSLGRKVVNVHARAEVPILMLGFTVPTVKTASSDDLMAPYALDVIADLLDAGDSGRVTARLVRGRQIANNIDVSYNLYARYETQFMLYGSPSGSHTLLELKQGLLSQLDRLKKEPVTEKELQRVKTQIIAQKTFERDSIFGQAMELGLLETVGLGWQTSEAYIERIQRVTASEIQKTAERYFQNNNMTEARLIPLTK